MKFMILSLFIALLSVPTINAQVYNSGNGGSTKGSKGGGGKEKEKEKGKPEDPKKKHKNNAVDGDDQESDDKIKIQIRSKNIEELSSRFFKQFSDNTSKCSNLKNYKKKKVKNYKDVIESLVAHSVVGLKRLEGKNDDLITTCDAEKVTCFVTETEKRILRTLVEMRAFHSYLMREEKMSAREAYDAIDVLTIVSEDK